MDDPDGLVRLRAFSCACPLGLWPHCGVGVTCGYWERRARLAHVTITTVDGLTRPFVLTLGGSPPAILLPAWVVGSVREYVLIWCLGELVRASLGEAFVDAQLARAVGLLEAS